MISLPKLTAHPYWHIGEDWSEKEIKAMQAYAREAQRMALEEACRILHDECHDDMTRAEEAAAIRRLANELDAKP